jgi:hypothetical protein
MEVVEMEFAPVGEVLAVLIVALNQIRIILTVF